MLKPKLILFLSSFFVVLSFSPLQAVDKYWIGSAGGSFEDDANWNTSSGTTPSNTTFPTNIDKAIFDGGDTDNCTINSAIDVLGIDIQSGYAGTITQGAGITIQVGASHFSQAGGTFIGSDASITTTSDGDFVLSGGSFTSTSGIFSINGLLTVSGAPTFNHNNGTLTSTSGSGHKNPITPGAVSYNNLILNQTSRQFRITGSMDINGDLAILSTGSIDGDFSVAGNVNIVQAVVSAVSLITSTITFDGTGDQNLDASGGTGGLPSIVINKASGTLTIADSLNAGGNWTHTAGTVVCTGTVTFTVKGHRDHVFNGMAFKHVIFNQSSNQCRINTGTMDIDGDLTITAVGPIQGNITVAGNLLTTDTSVGASSATNGNISMDGTGNQSLSASGGVGQVPGLTINKASGTLTISDTIHIDGNFTHTTGAVVCTGAVVFTASGHKTFVFNGMTFNDVEIAQGTNRLTISTGVMDIDGDLTLTTMSKFSGDITVAGNVDSTDTFIDATSSTDGMITFDGTGDQNAGSSTGFGDIPGMTINKASGTLTISDEVTVDGGFIHTAGTVVCTGTIVFTASTTKNLVFNGMAFNHLQISDNTAQNIVTGTMDVDGNLTLTAHKLTGPITLAGNLTCSDTFAPGTATITLDGSGNQDITYVVGAQHADGSMFINKSGGEVKLLTDLNLFSAGQDLIIEEGTLNLNGFDLTVADAFTIESGGNLQLFGSETVAITGTQDIQLGSTYIFTGDGDGAADPYTISNYQSAYGNLKINSSDGALDSFDTASDISASGNFSLLSGNYSMGAFNLTVAANLIIDGSLSQTAGDLAAASILVSATGDWQNHSTGDVTLGSGGVTNAGSISLDGTAAGCGDADNILLRSSSTGVQRTWVNSGSVFFQDLDIQDQGGVFSANSSIDSGNNGWTISPACPSAITWDGSAGDNLWSTAANWDTNSVPLIADEAVFDNTSDLNCNIDVTASVNGIFILAGYDGNVIPNSGIALTIDNSGFTQQAGAFSGGDSEITINSAIGVPSVFLTGGNFISTSSNLMMTESIRVWNAPTFGHNNGTVKFISSGSAKSHTPSTISLNDVIFDQGTDATSITGTLDIDGDLTITAMGDLTGAITLAGNVTSTDTDVGGTGTLTLDGSADQNISLATGEFADGALIISKSGGNAILLENLVLDDAGQDLTIQEGTLSILGYALNVIDAFTIESGGNLHLFGNETWVIGGTKDFQLGSLVTFTGNGDTSADTYTIGNYNTNFASLTINSLDGITDLFDSGSDITVSTNLIISSGNYLMGSANLIVSGNLDLTGILSQGSGNLTAENVVVNASGYWHNISTGDVTIGAGGVSSSGNITLDSNGLFCGDSDDILIRSSSSGVQRNWTGAGIFIIQDVDVQDQGGSATISAYHSSDSGNNDTNWTILLHCGYIPRPGVIFMGNAGFSF